MRGHVTFRQQNAVVAAELFDFSAFSLHDAKRGEMESQVRALELETELGRERTKLAALRKQHYHLAALVAKSHEPQAEPAT